MIEHSPKILSSEEKAITTSVLRNKPLREAVAKRLGRFDNRLVSLFSVYI